MIIKIKVTKFNYGILAGMDQNICITKIFSKDSHGCIVLSDITDQKTLDLSVKWKSTVDINSQIFRWFKYPFIINQK